MTSLENNEPQIDAKISDEDHREGGGVDRTKWNDVEEGGCR